MNKGFSLVELSIVLVILGLLTGGILSGQSLIRAAELRSVVTDYQRYHAAALTFRDKYMAVPGDFKDATKFWGKDNASCTGDTGTAATPGTCNGNGNGQIQNGTGASATGESFRFWQHMALAGLIEGTFSGNAGAVDEYDMDAAVNVPPARLGNAVWGLYRWQASWTGDVSIFDGSHGEWLQFGALSSTDNAGAILTPEEAWNIDTKLDDGKPGRGKMMVRAWGQCTTATTSAMRDSEYLLSVKTPRCVLKFVRLFNS